MCVSLCVSVPIVLGESQNRRFRKQAYLLNYLLIDLIVTAAIRPIVIEDNSVNKVFQHSEGNWFCSNPGHTTTIVLGHEAAMLDLNSY
jgi:hypothetical protein